MDIAVVVRNLGVVASLRPGEKLLTEGEHFVLYTPTPVRALVRAWYGESRELNMSRVESAIDFAKRHISAVLSEHLQQPVVPQTLSAVGLMRAEQLQVGRRLFEMLEGVVSGLEKLEETYKDDAAFVVRVSQAKLNLRDYVTRIRAHFPAAANAARIS